MAVASGAALQAINQAEVVVICPSNPIVSIGPIRAVPGFEAALRATTAVRVAISPIVGGKALKGPADKMLASLGHESSAIGVARLYDGIIDGFVVDEADRELAAGIEALGVRVAGYQCNHGNLRGPGTAGTGSARFCSFPRASAGSKRMTQVATIIVPFRSMTDGKSRLSPVLSLHEREHLNRRMLHGVLQAALDVRQRPRILVVSPDESTLNEVRMIDPGIETVYQEPHVVGLNGALELATKVAIGAGARVVAVVPADLPLIRGGDIENLLRRDAPVVIAPDRHRTGTNGLMQRHRCHKWGVSIPVRAWTLITSTRKKRTGWGSTR